MQGRGFVNLFFCAEYEKYRRILFEKILKGLTNKIRCVNMIVHTVPVCPLMVTHLCGIMIAQGRTVVKGSDTKSKKTYN